MCFFLIFLGLYTCLQFGDQNWCFKILFGVLGCVSGSGRWLAVLFKDSRSHWLLYDRVSQLFCFWGVFLVRVAGPTVLFKDSRSDWLLLDWVPRSLCSLGCVSGSGCWPAVLFKDSRSHWLSLDWVLLIIYWIVFDSIADVARIFQNCIADLFFLSFLKRGDKVFVFVDLLR